MDGECWGRWMEPEKVRKAEGGRGKEQDHGGDPKRPQGQHEAWVELVTSAPALVAGAFASAFGPEASAFEGPAAGPQAMDGRDSRRQWEQHNRAAGWPEEWWTVPVVVLLLQVRCVYCCVCY
jgi:hypothetical protein